MPYTIPLDSSGFSSAVHGVGVITATSRKELTRKVKEHHWRREGDNPGQAYMGYCQLLRALRGDGNFWQGICIFSTYYDI